MAAQVTWAAESLGSGQPGPGNSLRRQHAVGVDRRAGFPLSREWRFRNRCTGGLVQRTKERAMHRFSVFGPWGPRWCWRKGFVSRAGV